MCIRDRVYEAHGIAADVAAALPDLLTDAPAAGASKLRRLARREEHVWRRADGYVTITAGLARELERRFGPRPRLAVVPDGARVEENLSPMPQPPAPGANDEAKVFTCLLYTSDAADERSSVDLGGRRII